MKSARLRTILLCLILGILVMVGTGCACSRRKQPADNIFQLGVTVRTKGGNPYHYAPGEPRNKIAEGFYDGMMEALKTWNAPRRR